MTITINGQLSLCMLIEQILKLENSESIQSNTDGITVKVKRSDSDRVNVLVSEWENATRLTMERNDYKMMYVRDVNNYVAVYLDGKTKHKGAYEYKDLPHHKDQSMLIVPYAVSEFLVKGIPVEQTIKNHKNEFDFMLRTKVPRASKLILVDDEGKETLLQNVTRFYASNESVAGKLVKIMPLAEPKKTVNKDGTTTVEHDKRLGLFVSTEANFKPCNNMVDFNWDINYDFYIEEANKLIKLEIELEGEENE